MRMINITTIGTCRIRLPMEVMQRSLSPRLALDNRRVYGYTHSSKEALQAAEYMLGRIALDSKAWPFISDAPFRASADLNIALGDYFVLEISSLKKFTFRGVLINSNFVSRRTKSQSILRIMHQFPGPDQCAQREEHLIKEPAFNAMSPSIQQVVCQTIIEFSTELEIIHDLKKLKAMLGNLLVVTHCNVKTASGGILPERANCIDIVSRAAQANGLPVYNPSGAMLQFGQQQAMAAFGLDTAHYTPEFDRVVAYDIGTALAELHPPIRAAISNRAKADPVKSEDDPFPVKKFISELRRLQANGAHEELHEMLVFCFKTFANDAALRKEYRRILRDFQSDALIFKRFFKLTDHDNSDLIFYLKGARLDEELSQHLENRLLIADKELHEPGFRILINQGFIERALRTLQALVDQGVTGLDTSIERVIKEGIAVGRQKIEQGDLTGAITLIILAAGIRSDDKRLPSAFAHFDKAFASTRQDLRPVGSKLQQLIADHPSCVGLRLYACEELLRRDGPLRATEPMISFLSQYPSRVSLIVRLARHAFSSELYVLLAILTFSLTSVPERREESLKLAMQAFRDLQIKLITAQREQDPAVERYANGVLAFEPRNRAALKSLREILLSQGRCQEAYDVMRRMAAADVDSKGEDIWGGDTVADICETAS